jgi:transcriptional regulator with XRE-family HTH domain
MTELAKNLHNCRKNAGMTTTELGDRVGVSQAMISHYETNRKTPSVQTLERLATELAVSVDYLLGRSA